jgi:hypothetical protein
MDIVTFVTALHVNMRIKIFSKPVKIIKSPSELFFISHLYHSVPFVLPRLNGIISPQHRQFSGFQTKYCGFGYSFCSLSDG